MIYFLTAGNLSLLSLNKTNKKKAQELESLEINTFSRNSKPLDLHITGDIKENAAKPKKKNTDKIYLPFAKEKGAN